MIHPDTELVRISPDTGLGVRATAPIPAGTIVWTRDAFDVVLSPPEVDALPPPLRRVADVHGYVDSRGRRVVCWDAGRYVNHSCDPAIRGLGDDVMLARRDLRPGDEITCDYAECNLLQSLRCLCRVDGCRGHVGPHDLLDLHTAWDAEVLALLPHAARVEQPLRDVVLDRPRLDAVLSGRTPPPSLVTVHRSA